MENKVTKEIFNPINENIKKLESLFPGVVKDGQVDFEALKQELGQFEEVGKEKYELTWPGKTQAKQLVNTDIIGKTLKYVPEDSKNPETTENLYIEGDNLEVLKLLRNSYYGKIKMIYIDPPYNTGNDFVYKDRFNADKEIIARLEDEKDNNGERLIKNQKNSSYYHTNWLNMIYTRLKVAKDLLKDDGVIFISIDDNEIDNLKKVCNEIFGESNFIGCISRATGTTTGQDANKLGSSLDYCLCYSKSQKFELQGLPLSEKDRKRFNKEDENGKYALLQLRKTGNADRREDRPNMFYPVTAPDGTKVYPIGPSGYASRWRVEEKKYKLWEQEGIIVWKQSETDEQQEEDEDSFIEDDVNDNEDGNYIISDHIEFDKSPWTPYVKYYLEGRTKKPSNLWTDIDGNKKGSIELKQLFHVPKVFDNPKPVQFIQRLINISTSKNDIIMDFFAGSGTTAQAVFKCNIEENYNRKFILVQIDEELSEKNKSQKVALELLKNLNKDLNISEVTKERIRRAGERIKEEFKNKEGIEKLDIGFKVFKVADTNIRWNSEALKEGQITLDEASLKNKDLIDFNPGFTDIDVVYEIMLRHRDFPLTSKIERLSNIGERTYIFADAVVVCLEEKITNQIVDGIAAIEPKPIKVIFRDSAFDDDISLKLNTMNRLDAQLKKHNQGKEQSYRVEFI
jgi:adenine-specific DNA-methyltransferase